MRNEECIFALQHCFLRWGSEKIEMQIEILRSLTLFREDEVARSQILSFFRGGVEVTAEDVEIIIGSVEVTKEVCCYHYPLKIH